jgi:hypothetical protein
MTVPLRVANKVRVCNRHDPAANSVRSSYAGPKVTPDNATQIALAFLFPTSKQGIGDLPTGRERLFLLLSWIEKI